jgi:hypothetical protein
MAVRLLFILGIVIAVVASVVTSSLLPWVVGGTGILTGIVAWKTGARGILILAIVLVVSLSAIREQPFNPAWLTAAVFFVRVFCAHVGLATGLLGVLVPQKDGGWL